MRSLALVLALMMPVFAGHPMTHLTIVVKNADGKPVDNASVIVRFVKGHSLVKLGKAIRKEWELRTNQEGTVRLPSIPQGTIQIQVIAKNYQTAGDNYDVDEAEKTIQIKLNKPQPQYSAH